MSTTYLNRNHICLFPAFKDSFKKPEEKTLEFFTFYVSFKLRRKVKWRGKSLISHATFLLTNWEVPTESNVMVEFQF